MLSWVLAALLAAGTRPSVRATLKIPSHFANMPPGGASVRLVASLRVVDERGLLGGCPAFIWEWGDGERSTEEPTCGPGRRPVQVIVSEHVHPYHVRGEMVILVRVVYAGREWARVETPFTIN